MVTDATLLWVAPVAQSHVVERPSILPLEGDPATPVFTFERTIIQRGPETVV